MKAQKEKLSMEEYIDFVVSPKEVDLSARFLNQIISMHGFKRIHKTRKSVLSDALKTLDLMDPFRSTLKENISPCAAIASDDIMMDLNELSWQECCVTSIKTLTSCHDKHKVNFNAFLSDQRSNNDASKVPKPTVCFAGEACGVSGDLAVSTSSYSGAETDGKTKRKRTRPVNKVGWHV